MKDLAAQAAKRTAQQGQRALLERWQAFREESPYFQAKVGLVAGWIVIALLTIVLAPPPDIEFVVEQKKISFGLAEKPALIIDNRAGGDLDEGSVEVRGTQTDFDGKTKSGTWRTKSLLIVEGVKTTLSTESFFDEQGLQPGYQLHIDYVVIRDDDDVVWQGVPGAKP